MSVSVQSIIDKVRILINDVDAEHWTNAELVGWLSDAQQEIATYKPDTATVSEPVPLKAGSRQTLPAGGISLTDVTHNVTAEGAGEAIRRVNRLFLDTMRPGWQSQAKKETIKAFCFDDRDPRSFYVWPPCTAGTRANLVYVKSPEALTLEGSFGLQDPYSIPAASYVAFRAFSKDADFAADGSRAAEFYAHFSSYLAGKEAGEQNSEPPRQR